MIFSNRCGIPKTMSWHKRYDLEKQDSTESETPVPVVKQLPAAAGIDVTDQSGWQTTWVDAPPNLPATTSLYYDTEETLAKAVDLVAELKKDITKEQSE